jgi:hypothetical protein
MFKSKNGSELVTNKHIGETKKMGIMEDDYTIAERKARDLASLRGQSPTDTFIDASGNKIPVSQLNGQTEQLLREARESIKAESLKGQNLIKAKDISDNFPPTGKLNKKLYIKTDLYNDKFPESSENLKTNSPAKRRLDVKKTRKAHEEQNWSPIEKEDDFMFETELVNEKLNEKM